MRRYFLPWSESMASIKALTALLVSSRVSGLTESIYSLTFCPERYTAGTVLLPPRESEIPGCAWRREKQDFSELPDSRDGCSAVDKASGEKGGPAALHLLSHPDIGLGSGGRGV